MDTKYITLCVGGFWLFAKGMYVMDILIFSDTRHWYSVIDLTMFSSICIFQMCWQPLDSLISGKIHHHFFSQQSHGCAESSPVTRWIDRINIYIISQNSKFNILQ